MGDRLDRIKELVDDIYRNSPANQKELHYLILEELRYLRDEVKQDIKLRRAMLEALR